LAALHTFSPPTASPPAFDSLVRVHKALQFKQPLIFHGSVQMFRFYGSANAGHIGTSVAGFGFMAPRLPIAARVKAKAAKAKSAADAIADALFGAGEREVRSSRFYFFPCCGTLTFFPCSLYFGKGTSSATAAVAPPVSLLDDELTAAQMRKMHGWSWRTRSSRPAKWACGVLPPPGSATLLRGHSVRRGWMLLRRCLHKQVRPVCTYIHTLLPQPNLCPNRGTIINRLPPGIAL